VLLMLVGISWAAIADTSAEVSVAIGDRQRVDGYEIRLDGLTSREEPHRRVIVARLTVFDDAGEEVVTLQPSLNLYPASTEPIGTPSLRVGTPWNGMRDLYSSLVTVDAQSRSATIRFFVNPGIGLLWAGGFVAAAGGLLAAWPSRPRTAVAPEPDRPRVREEVRV
jgi:cytochrome c-type biogenesis protein CcmF